MKIHRPLIVLAALGGAMSALACDVPEASIDMPRGDEATREEMLATQSSVRELQAATDDYLSCMDAEIDALSDETPEDERAAMVSQRDAAITRLEEVAAEFNEQIRLFQAKETAEN